MRFSSASRSRGGEAEEAEGEDAVADDVMDDEEEVSGGIRVSVRIRPLNERELNENQTISWECTDTALHCENQKGHKRCDFHRK